MAPNSKAITLAVAVLHRPIGPGRYLRAVIGLLAGFSVLCMGLLFYLNQCAELPPPPLSDDMSFNEKAQFLRGLSRGNIQIIAAGSSLTLNDLSSDALVAAIPVHPVMINIAAWGMKISETRLWLNHVVKRFGSPVLVLIFIGSQDFQAEKGWYGRADGYVDGYLSRRLQPALFLGNFSFVNYVKLSGSMKEYRTSRRMYESLDFDRDGSIPLDISYPHVDVTRWDYVNEYDKIDARQYDELNTLAEDMTLKGIALVCVQPPVRRVTMAKENLIQAENYQARVAEILQKNNQTLLNFKTALDLDDSNFADSIHLNVQGAQLFSQIVGRELASMREWSASSASPR